jgi:hypothetical protein
MVAIFERKPHKRGILATVVAIDCLPLFGGEVRGIKRLSHKEGEF